MKSKTAKIIAAALFLILILAGCSQKESEESTSDFPNLKSFTAVTLAGDSFSERDLADVDLTMINIWSTTCGPCLREMPELGELSKELPDNVRLVTFCIDSEYYADSARDILNNAGFDGVTLVSGDGDLAKLLESVMYVPTTIFVDSKGIQAGQPVIGAPNDAAAYYTQCINDALASLGKDTI